MTENHAATDSGVATPVGPSPVEPTKSPGGFIGSTENDFTEEARVGGGAEKRVERSSRRLTENKIAFAYEEIKESH
jgi:hypothetical protein